MTGIVESPRAAVGAAALDFVTAYTAGWSGFAQVAYIDPNSDALRFRTVSMEQLGELAAFIDQNINTRNLHFTVAPLQRIPVNGKPGKADVLHSTYLHLDLDPREGESLEQARVRIRQEIATFPIAPTFIIDSGNGFQCFWQLKEPVATAVAEDLNRRLCAYFKTPDDCWSCEHLMRLPGTMNLPNAAKRGKGRVEAPATLIEQNDNAYDAEAFAFLPVVAPKVKTVMPPTRIGTPINLDSYGLDDDQRSLVAGSLSQGQRSEVLHALLINLLDDGHPRDDALATVHAEPGLVDYCTSKHPSDPAAFALAELAKAWAKSTPGMLSQLAYFHPGWADLDAAIIRAFSQGGVVPSEASQLAAAIRFDARPTTLDELDAVDPPQEYVIDPIYPKGIPAEFAGAHGIGKSINGEEQCCCVAAGRPWQGLKVMQGKVVFASWEDPRQQIMRRVKTWLRNIKDPMERAEAKRALAENLLVLGCDEIELMLTAKAFGACSVRDEVIDLIAERCQGSVLVVLETAALMHGGDELNEDLAQLAKAVKLITNRTGAGVVTIRHVSKDAARNRTVDAYVGRGGGSFTGAMRSMTVLVDVDAEVVRKRGIGLGDAAVAMGRPVLAYHHVKANYGEKMKEPIYLVVMPDGHMERVAGPDERQAQSDMLLEWLREHMEDGGLAYTAIRKARKDYGNPQQGMVRVLLECLKNQGHVRGKKVPGRGRYAEVEMWELVKRT